MAFTLNLGNLHARLTADNSNFAKTMRQTEAILDKTAKKMKKIGKTMTKYVTLPLTIMGAASVKAFANFDDAMTQSLAIMSDVTPKMRKQMEDLADTISDKSITTSTELAKSYFFLASAGLTAEQSLAALATVERFAVAGRFDMAQATDLLTDAQSALGLTVKDSTQNMENMNRISDVLVKANTLANASVEQFSTALTTKAGTAMKSYNIKLEEGVSILAAYADQGIKGQLAGSMFDRMLRLTIRSINENQEAWNKWGITTQDAEGNLAPIADILEQITNKTKDMGAVQKAAALEMLGFQARSQQAILPLLGLSDKIRKYEEDLISAGGVTQEVADKQLKSFSAQMKIVWNNVVNASKQIGDIFAPTVGWLGEKIKKLTDWFRGLDKATKKWIVGLAIAAAVIGPLLVGLGTFAAFLSFAAGMLPVLITGMGILISMVTALWVAIAPYAIAVGIFVAIGVAVWALVDAFSSADLKIVEFFRNITIGGEKIGTWFDVLATHIWGSWDWAVNKMALGWENFKISALTVGGAVKRFFLGVGEFVANAMWTMIKKVGFAFTIFIKKQAMNMNRAGLMTDSLKLKIVNAANSMNNTLITGAKKTADFYVEKIKESTDKSAEAWMDYHDKVDILDRKALVNAEIWANARKDILTPLQPEEIAMETVEDDPAVIAIEQANMQIKTLLNDRFVITKDEIDKEKALISQRNQAMLSGTGALFGAMAAVAKAGGKKNFKIWKALSMAEAIISTHSAVTKALASPPGPPATIPMAIATATMGFLRVRQIAMTQIGGGGGGGAGGLGGGAGVGITPITRAEEPGIGGEDERLERPDKWTLIIENIHGSADAEFARQLAQEIYDISGDGVDYGFETTSS